MDRSDLWLIMGYSVPVTPSKLRVYVWRKLKELGVGYFRPGVAILPKNVDSTKALRTLAAKIRSVGGEAVLAEMSYLDESDHRATAEEFAKIRREEFMILRQNYDKFMELVRKDASKEELGRSATKLKTMLEQYRKKSPASLTTDKNTLGDIEEAMGEISTTLKSVTDELKGLLQGRKSPK